MAMMGFNDKWDDLSHDDLTWDAHCKAQEKIKELKEQIYQDMMNFLDNQYNKYFNNLAKRQIYKELRQSHSWNDFIRAFQDSKLVFNDRSLNLSFRKAFKQEWETIQSFNESLNPIRDEIKLQQNNLIQFYD